MNQLFTCSAKSMYIEIRYTKLIGVEWMGRQSNYLATNTF